MLIDPKKILSLCFALQVYRPGSEMDRIINLEIKTWVWKRRIILKENHFQSKFIVETGDNIQ